MNVAWKPDIWDCELCDLTGLATQSKEENTPYNEYLELGLAFLDKNKGQHPITKAHARMVLKALYDGEELEKPSMKMKFNENNNDNDYLPTDAVKQVASIADTLEETYQFLSFGRGRPLWYYDSEKGIWIEKAEEMLQKEALELLDRHKQYRSRIANEVVFYMQDKYYNEDVELDKVPHIIVVRNGNLNLETGELDPEFQPEQYHSIRVDIEYDKEKVSTYTLSKLREIMSNEEDVQALLEIFGYCLFKEFPFDIFAIFVGAGANGKSVVLELLEKFLGADNVSNKTLHALSSNQFASSSLFGKLANLTGEISNREITYTENIKDLTGGGYIDAEKKRQDSFKFRNFAKMIFSSNNPPPINDDSYGFWRRLREFTFPNTFARNDPKTIPRDRLLELMTTEEELSGLLNLAVEGYQRLRKNGMLTGAEEPEMVRIRYLKKSNPAKYFAETFLEQNTQAPPIIKSSLYEVYQRWCGSIKQTGISAQVFYTKIRTTANYISEQQKYHPRDENGRRRKERCFVNVDLDVDALNKLRVNMSDLEIFFENREQPQLDGFGSDV